jgi:hypothetical protein
VLRDAWNEPLAVLEDPALLEEELKQ